MSGRGRNSGAVRFQPVGNNVRNSRRDRSMRRYLAAAGAKCSGMSMYGKDKTRNLSLSIPFVSVRNIRNRNVRNVRRFQKCNTAFSVPKTEYIDRKRAYLTAREAQRTTNPKGPGKRSAAAPLSKHLGKL